MTSVVVYRIQAFVPLVFEKDVRSRERRIRSHYLQCAIADDFALCSLFLHEDFLEGIRFLRVGFFQHLRSIHAEGKQMLDCICKAIIYDGF